MTINFPLSNIGKIFQLTSSRRGWRYLEKKTIRLDIISTHILTKRMTLYNAFHLIYLNISTHILTKRMTSFILTPHCLKKHFNSHPHEEDDQIELRWIRNIEISTHILTKRMTIRNCRRKTQTGSFQLTSSRRGWQIVQEFFDFDWNISTHILTKRMTTWACKRVMKLLYFNSHPHEEDDISISAQQIRRCNISTHILTKRMTIALAIW